MINKSPFSICLLFLLCVCTSMPGHAAGYVLHSIERELDIHPLVPESKSIQIEISKGDTIVSALNRVKLKPGEIAQVVSILNGFYNPKSLHENDMINVIVGGYNSIDSFSLTPSHMRSSINIFRHENGEFVGKLVNNIKNKKIVRTRDNIRSSLFETASEQGMFSSTIMKLTEIYKKRLDVDKKLTQGSILDVLFERFFDSNDRPLLDGKILYTSIKTDNAVLSLYNYSTNDGYNGYFDSEGNAVGASTFGTPIEDGNYRISSTFGRRKHPIYGYYIMHQGVDLAAPSGTPIMATNNGIVDFAGQNGGYGRYIKVKHDRGYSTAYAHLSSFAKNIRKGAKVYRGQVIGYVGVSGITTGAHLHYEILKNGKRIDPLSILGTRRVTKIPKTELPRFNNAVTKINLLLEKTPYKTEVAMNTPSPDHKVKILQKNKEHNSTKK